MERTAHAKWGGDLMTGRGSIRLGSGAYEGPYTFKTRFQGEPGANPEELLGAAHAGCFSMQLANDLAQAGHTPTQIETTASVRVEKVADGYAVTAIELTTNGDVPGLSQAEFERAADHAKANCIVSKALGRVPMTVRATLKGA